MAIIFAYDGGGTKTRLAVLNEAGQILYDQTTTGCNIFSIGDEPFKQVISQLYHDALTKLKLQPVAIDFIYLGLSGADLREDYERLYQATKPIFGNIPYEIANDAWIVLRSGLSEPYGATCICGTGTNAAAINHDGQKAILRSLSYTLGTYGGGLDIAREALHYAFRAEEMTYQETILKTEIPKLLGVPEMKDVVPLFYPERTIDKQSFGSITGLVGECALKGDQVSLMILANVAKHIALQTTGVIRQLGMEDKAVPVVIGGRVFQLEDKIFLDIFETTLKGIVKDAKIVKPRFAPVIGAYFFALDKLNITQTKAIEEALLESGGGL